MIKIKVFDKFTILITKENIKLSIVRMHQIINKEFEILLY